MECPNYSEFCDFGTGIVVATVVVQLATHLCATVSSWLLLSLLRRLCVCHVHMRTIFVQIILAIVVSNLYGMFEFVVVVYGVLVDSRSNAYTCVSITQGSMPNGVLLAIGCFGFVLVVERVYATYNYLRYEDFNIETFVQYTCLFIWFVVIITIFGSNAYTAINAAGKNNLKECTETDPLKANTGNLMTALLYSIYSFLFAFLIKYNKEKRKHYTSYFNEGLGGRYQLMENISATQMLMPLTAGITVYCFGCFVFDWMREPSIISVVRLVFKAFFFPIFFIYYPFHIITSSTVLKRNAKTVLKQWTSHSGNTKTADYEHECMHDFIEFWAEQKAHFS